MEWERRRGAARFWATPVGIVPGQVWYPGPRRDHPGPCVRRWATTTPSSWMAPTSPSKGVASLAAAITSSSPAHQARLERIGQVAVLRQHAHREAVLAAGAARDRRPGTARCCRRRLAVVAHRHGARGGDVAQVVDDAVEQLHFHVVRRQAAEVDASLAPSIRRRRASGRRRWPRRPRRAPGASRAGAAAATAPAAAAFFRLSRSQAAEALARLGQ